MTKLLNRAEALHLNTGMHGSLSFSENHPVDPAYAKGITSLSDGYPYLIISQASLDDLNARIHADRMISGSDDQIMGTPVRRTRR